MIDLQNRSVQVPCKLTCFLLSECFKKHDVKWAVEKVWLKSRVPAHFLSHRR